MARRTVVQLVDDLTGEELEPGVGETVKLGLDGVTYEIDLSADSASKLRGDIAQYVAAARRVGGRSSRPSGRAVTGVDPRAVRAWAASNGIELSSRGRVPASVVDQFRAAGN